MGPNKTSREVGRVQHHYPTKKLRLLVTEECRRNCAGCCNKDWDLKALPVCTDFKGFTEVLLTGGEPLQKLDRLGKALFTIRVDAPDIPVYLYTAYVEGLLIEIALGFVDGITLTLHDQSDADKFEYLHDRIYKKVKGKSMRLNVFKGVKVKDIPDYWVVKDNIEWMKDCPLPTNETFMRLED